MTFIITYSKNLELVLAATTILMVIRNWTWERIHSASYIAASCQNFSTQLGPFLWLFDYF